jgi:hypothetical protein
MLPITGRGERHMTILMQSEEKLGVTAHAVFQSIDDAHDVTVWHDFSTVESAKSFASSARLKEVMGKAGVKGVPQNLVCERSSLIPPFYPLNGRCYSKLGPAQSVTGILCRGGRVNAACPQIS